MNWSTASSEDARGELSRAISAQLARASEVLDVPTDLASSVHEARRAIKRARALLRLADPWPGNSPIECTLRDASRVLAVLRDADVLVLTATGICEGSEAAEPHVVPAHLLESLKEERGRHFTGSGSAEGPLRTAEELLRSATLKIGEPQSRELTAGDKTTASSGRELLRFGLAASYASVRARSDPTAGEGRADERFHKLRKRVKDLRYQLEFLDTGQPELGVLVRDLHRLTDLLGDKNDLAGLSAHATSTDVLGEIEREALTVHVEELKQTLGEGAAALSARLFEEETDSFVSRIEAWVAPPQG